jgi:hypothetical protein
VKTGISAALITVILAAAVTACSSSPGGAVGTRSHASAGSTAPAATAVLSSDPICQRFHRELTAWKAAVAEPGNANTVLLNSSTRAAWQKFGHQLVQLSHAAKRGNDAVDTRTAKVLARTASLVTTQATEPVRRATGAQYQRTATGLQEVTGDCTILSRS